MSNCSIVRALDHITEKFPNVCQVFYGINGEWFYCDENFNGVDFDGLDVNFNLLEAAASEVYIKYGFPHALSINNC